MVSASRGISSPLTPRLGFFRPHDAHWAGVRTRSVVTVTVLRAAGPARLCLVLGRSSLVSPLGSQHDASTSPHQLPCEVSFGSDAPNASIVGDVPPTQAEPPTLTRRALGMQAAHHRCLRSRTLSLIPTEGAAVSPAAALRFQTRIFFSEPPRGGLSTRSRTAESSALACGHPGLAVTCLLSLWFPQLRTRPGHCLRRGLGTLLKPHRTSPSGSSATQQLAWLSYTSRIPRPECLPPGGPQVPGEGLEGGGEAPTILYRTRWGSSAS